MIIPQSLAYTTIIGLPPQYGLYSAFMGTFVYSIFGPTKEMFLGPSALLCLAVASYKKASYTWPAYTVLLTLLGGLVQLAMGFFGLGSVVNLISLPVTCGFTCSIAVTVGISQLKIILGLENIPRDFFPMVLTTFKHIDETNVWDLCMGIVCVVWLICLKMLHCIKWPDDSPRGPSTFLAVTKKIVWFIVLARNALMVVLAAVAVMILERRGYIGVFTLSSGNSKDIGIPAFKVMNNFSLLHGSTTVIKEQGCQIGQGKTFIFQGQGKVRKFCIKSGKV